MESQEIPTPSSEDIAFGKKSFKIDKPTINPEEEPIGLTIDIPNETKIKAKELEDRLLTVLSLDAATIYELHLKDYFSFSFSYGIFFKKIDKIEQFIDRLAQNKVALDKIRDYPKALREIYPLIYNPEILEDPEKIDNFIKNLKLYSKERKEAEKRTEERIKNNPIAN